MSPCLNIVINETDLIHKIQKADKMFRRARKQVLILNDRIEALLVRYKRSERDNRKTLKSTMRLQVSTIEGVRNMYYEYARRQCEVIDDLQMAMKSLTGEEYDDFADFE